MQQFNILSRRAFLDRTFKTSLAVAMSTLADIPFVMKRALAEGNIGLNGKKILFIWLRFGNDSLNSVIPIVDSTYSAIRQNIGIVADTGTTYNNSGNLAADFPQGDATNTYTYDNAIRLGNGFAALHPRLKFLAPVYNAGDLALIHRVGYPKQSRSHFDSQNYWENGNPNNNLSKDGIFYRAMIESGLANTSPLTGVSIQSALPLLLRGSAAAMTNLNDPNRYDLFGVPNTTAGDAKSSAALNAANGYPFPSKLSRDLLQLQYQNMANTLQIFAGIDFNENASSKGPGNYFRDDEVTDGDQVWRDGTPNTNSADSNRGYYLFPTTNVKNGGYRRPDGTSVTGKYVVSTSHQNFFSQLKAAAQILNNTDAIIAGTEISGFDTHSAQGTATGTHADLQRAIGWSMYALRKYFTLYANKANWNNVVVVTLSEFGRTSMQNSTVGTDHAEAGVMFVAGGAVKGFGKGNPSGVFGCSPGDAIPWIPGPLINNYDTCGTMFAAGTRPVNASSFRPTAAGYLRRSCDYRSVLGEIIRKHLGATQNQLNRIIPGYVTEPELGGQRVVANSLLDGTPIIGEVGIL